VRIVLSLHFMVLVILAAMIVGCDLRLAPVRMNARIDVAVDGTCSFDGITFACAEGGAFLQKQSTYNGTRVTIVTRLSPQTQHVDAVIRALKASQFQSINVVEPAAE
jgi:hypothetical protein